MLAYLSGVHCNDIQEQSNEGKRYFPSSNVCIYQYTCFLRAITLSLTIINYLKYCECEKRVDIQVPLERASSVTNGSLMFLIIGKLLLDIASKWVDGCAWIKIVHNKANVFSAASSEVFQDSIRVLRNSNNLPFFVEFEFMICFQLRVLWVSCQKLSAPKKKNL